MQFKNYFHAIKWSLQRGWQSDVFKILPNLLRDLVTWHLALSAHRQSRGCGKSAYPISYKTKLPYLRVCLEFTTLFTDVWTSCVTEMLYHCLPIFVFHSQIHTVEFPLKMPSFDLNFIYARPGYFMHAETACLTATYVFLLLLSSQKEMGINHVTVRFSQ